MLTSATWCVFIQNIGEGAGRRNPSGPIVIAIGEEIPSLLVSCDARV
jgi:hypothetical protein